MSRWFRFYDDVLTDPKIQGLPLWVRWIWVEMLCVASKNGGDLGTATDLATALSRRPLHVRTALLRLSQDGLVDLHEKSYRPHNWEDRQYKSDVSTQRVKQYRERKNTTKGNVSCNVSETAHNRTEQNPLTPLKGESKKDALQGSKNGSKEEKAFVSLHDPKWKVMAARHAAEFGKDPPTSDRTTGWWFPAEWLNGAG